jgi:hypothetical protein
LQRNKTGKCNLGDCILTLIFPISLLLPGIFEFYSLFFRIPEVYLFIYITCQARTQTFLEGGANLVWQGVWVQGEAR